MLSRFIWVGVVAVVMVHVPALAGPMTLHHQGVVAVHGERFTGDGAFRFALVDPNTNGYLWVNDGSAVSDPDAPTDAVSLTVINGVYNVRLGDVAVANMTAIPDTVFLDNPDVVLRVWFDDGTNGTHVLSPDVHVGSVAHAVHAASSDGLVVPGSSDVAVVVAPDGDVSVESGDLSVTAGNAVINGDLTVAGTITNFSIVGPFTASRTTDGIMSRNLVPAAGAFCALTRHYASGLDSNDFSGCTVRVSGNLWVLEAQLDVDFIEPGSIACQAHCLVFDD